jgi:uncharacterized protein (TIGR02588 family)
MTTKRAKKHEAAMPQWSWILAGFGAVLVAGAVGFMTYEAFFGDATPPRIEVAIDKVLPSGDRYLAMLSVTNHGGTAAAQVVVEGDLRAGDETLESSSVTLNYVPAGSRRRAGLLFQHDPRKYQLRVAPRGFELP